MAVSRTLIRTVALQGGTPAECLSTANNLLSQESVNSMFVTVFYAIYNTKTGAIDYCNGGHNQPCVMHADGTLEMLSMTNSYVLGAFAGLPYQDGKARLGVGDTLLMYTDGVNEAFNTSFEQYGDSRMLKALEGLCQKNSQEIIDGLHQDVNAFVGEAPQSDDITLLALKRKV
jgi:sigma-B regulation protein RsbU (phosphoserine phosphatase)